MGISKAFYVWRTFNIHPGSYLKLSKDRTWDLFKDRNHDVQSHVASSPFSRFVENSYFSKVFQSR